MEIQISFIIPLYNEAPVLQKLTDRIISLSEKIDKSIEVILIDDGSVDDTPILIKRIALANPLFHAIILSRNFGHQYAVSAGLKYARAKEVAMILDGDLQDPPELFFEFYKLNQQGFEVIYGVRRKRKEHLLKKSSYYLFYRILRKISDSEIPVDSGDFSMLSRRVIDILNQMPEDSRFLRGMRSWVGFRQIGVEYERDVRAEGVSKYSLFKLIRLAYDGIFNFSNFPVKFLTYSGAFCFILSLVYFLITLIRKVIWDDVPVGFTSLLFMIILFGGIQLLSIGILGEYVFRTFLQVKSRPLFLVKEIIKEGKVVVGETN
jgi:dolichol-phosphate mannosyltransferase